MTQPNPGGALGSAASLEGPVSLLHVGPLLTAQRPLRQQWAGHLCARLRSCARHLRTYSTGQSSVPGPHPAPRGARKGTLVCAQEGEANSSFCHIGIPLLPFTRGSERRLGHRKAPRGREPWPWAGKDGRILPTMGWVLCVEAQRRSIHRDPSPSPPPRGHFPGHMGTELNYRLGQDGVVSIGRAYPQYPRLPTQMSPNLISSHKDKAWSFCESGRSFFKPTITYSLEKCSKNHSSFHLGKCDFSVVIM
uniref:Uncharacterized protein n=1 Tax=Myotis myotis TaxID=51298 RepID=A0A7J7ZY86_MYOMY|nr:hypothetical protein mMyoMyo1_009922 [Myotis myotis]